MIGEPAHLLGEDERALVEELVVLCAIAGRTDDALGLLRGLAALEPASPAPWVGMALVLLASNRPDEALATASEASRRAPGDPSARAVVAGALAGVGRFGELGALLEAMDRDEKSVAGGERDRRFLELADRLRRGPAGLSLFSAGRVC